MFSTMANLFSKGQAQSVKSRQRTGVQPILEVLEKRDVPTVMFNPQFGTQTVSGTNDGMISPNVYVVFSGSYWNTTQGQQDETALLASTKNILTGPYLSGLTQYGSDGKAFFASSWNDLATVPSNPSTTALQNFLQTSIHTHGASPGLNSWQRAPIYIVVSDPTSSAQFNGGWNNQGTYNQSLGFISIPENMHMIWVGTSSSGGKVWKDAFTETVSHELAETMSDPDSNGIIVTPPSTLPAVLKGGFATGQIGDFEPEPGGQPHYGYRLGNDLVQPYWSRADSAFIVPDGNSQKFYLTPLWNGTNFTAKYDLSIVGDQLGTNYADNIRLDGASNVSVNQNNQVAMFDPGAIRNVNINTGGGTNTVRLASVPAGVTVNVDSGGKSNDAVTIGNDSHSLVNILGTVNVANTSGQTHLFVDDAGDGPRTIGITDHSVSFSGLTTIGYTGGTKGTDGVVRGVTWLTVTDGKGPNNVSVASKPALTKVDLFASFSDSITGAAAGLINVFRNHS
jgi:hypothetical protein